MRYENSYEEAALIAAAQDGDEQAMEALILPHKPLLQALAGRFFCPYLSKDELIQAGYLGLMCAVGHYRGDQNSSLITYAVPWILGEIRKALRKEALRMDLVSLDQQRSSEEKITLLDELKSPDGISIEKIDLNLALRSLSHQERMVVCLRYYRDMTQKETAQVLRCSQAQISRIEKRAIERLHACLA